MATEFPSRYDFGVKEILHKGKLIKTSINTDFMDNFHLRVVNGDYNIGTVKIYVAHRPDTISDIMYNTAAYWWYLQLYNGISDPFERLNPSDSIMIPIINEFL